jgi:hypothetical protein
LTQFTYQIVFEPASIEPIDITDFAERIEWNEVGTGQVRNATIRLNAQDGQFITRATQQGTGVSTPILQQFDKISIGAEDRDGTTRLHVFEVDILKPIQNAQQGTILEVELMGLENQLLKVNFAKPFFLQGGASGFNVARDIVDFYNDPNSKGDAQPVVIGNNNNFIDSFGGLIGFNELPTWTANEYHFELTEQSAYDGLDILADRLGSSVSAGGAGDFFEIYFETDLADTDQLLFKGFISGNPPTQQVDPDNGDTTFDPTKAVTITDTVAVNPGEEEGGIESIKGNLTGTWGADGISTLPSRNARFIGALEIYPLFVTWSAGTFPTDAIVQIDVVGADGFNEHYEANTTTTDDPNNPSTEWDLITFNDFLGNVGAATNYTAWTNGLANAWKNSGANVDGALNQDPPTVNSLKAWDSNLVVIDGTFSRTWTHTAEVDSTLINSNLLYASQFFYRGFRVLVNGTAPNTPGNIFFGAGFDNKIIKYDGTKFVVFRDPDDNGLCAVDDTAEVFEKSGGTWSITTRVRGNECYHPVWAIGNDQGHNNTSNGLGSNYGIFAAVTYEYRYQPTDQIIGSTIESEVYYRTWVGACWQTPYPPNSFNGQTIGNFYGQDSTIREPVTVDVSNMHMSSNSKIGFNHSFAEDLGPIDAVTFFVKFVWKFTFDGTGANVLQGNFPFRCTMYDTSDNVVIQDFNIPFNGEWAPISLPINNFEIYRARKPVIYESLLSDVFLQDREVLQRFEYHNICKISIHWLGAYDSEGRYNMWDISKTIFPDAVSLIGGLFGYNVKLSIDSFQFAKAGLAISDPITTDRAIQPRFYNEPLISNFVQLRQANFANKDRANFQETRYDTVTEGLFDINFGDTFFLENEFIVNNSDNGPNTVQLVAKKINYVIDKTPTGPGGFLRTIEGAKRLT